MPWQVTEGNVIAVTALSQLLNERMPENWNADRVVTEAEHKLGRTVDRSTVFRMLKGDHADNPRRATLEVFASVLPVTVDELRAALALPALGDPFHLPEEAARLTPKQRRAITAIVNAMLEPDESNVVVQFPAATTNEPEPRATKAAAKRGRPRERPEAGE